MIPDPAAKSGRMWDPHMVAEPVLMRSMLLIALVAITIAVPFILLTLLELQIVSDAFGEAQLVVAALILFGGGVRLVTHFAHGGWTEGMLVVTSLASGLMVGAALLSAARSRS